MKKKIKGQEITIVVEGGVVQNVVFKGPKPEYVWLLDYDNLDTQSETPVLLYGTEPKKPKKVKKSS